MTNGTSSPKFSSPIPVRVPHNTYTHECVFFRIGNCNRDKDKERADK